MLSIITTVASPFLVSWLTQLTKNHVLAEGTSTAIVRLMCAILALALALLTSLLSHGTWATDPTSLVNDFVLALVNFLGATGIFHLAQPAVPGQNTVVMTP